MAGTTQRDFMLVHVFLTLLLYVMYYNPSTLLYMC